MSATDLLRRLRGALAAAGLPDRTDALLIELERKSAHNPDALFRWTRVGERPASNYINSWRDR